METNTLGISVGGYELRSMWRLAWEAVGAAVARVEGGWAHLPLVKIPQKFRPVLILDAICLNGSALVTSWMAFCALLTYLFMLRPKLPKKALRSNHRQTELSAFLFVLLPSVGHRHVRHAPLVLWV